MAIAYVQNALAFVFLDAGINSLVRRIYLFGSAARGGIEKKSDIDVFIDCKPENERTVEGIAKSAISRFYKSRDYEKWGLLKFEYPISVQAGDISGWQLKTSVMAEGILLYSNKAEITAAERKAIFTLELPKGKKEYVSFIRGLFGRKEKGFKDNGKLGEANGTKVSSNVIIVPKESQKNIEEFLQKRKISYSMREIAVFE
ncbi:nucleotidyltransferase domain-containing protein [Candidatus Woesearchaeota archaeon]|nr:nucleotidyltransferase domain-containing protein [Candidatus Woesearchaeota archaeon]